MRRYLLLVTLILLFSSPTYGQTELWGLASQGGDGAGVIFKTDGNGNFLETFNIPVENSGLNPHYTKLCEAANGKLYGLTQTGGALNYGTLFSYDPTSNELTKIIDFDLDKGRYPFGSLIQASNGLLYGLTSGYINPFSSSTDGTLFEFDPSNNSFATRVTFNGSNGERPYGSLEEASNGKLYGMTRLGGSNSLGTLFEFETTSNVLTKRIDFTGTSNGSYPFGSLIQSTNGKLYGMTSSGGTNNRGTLFEFELGSNTLTKLIEFSGTTNGSTPYGSLIEGVNGKLYGLTSSGGINNLGTLFELETTTNSLTKLIDFSGTNTGSSPQGSLLEATNGKLYGMTQAGGLNNFGTLFEFEISTNSLIKMVDLSDAVNGRSPVGSLIEAANGKIYGMTRIGGENSSGTLFEYEINTQTLTKRIDFNGTSNGKNPFGSLIQPSSGELYGFTTSGGANNMGILFQFDPVNEVYATLIDFDGSSNGSSPYGSLIEAADGHLYGMTRLGGSNNYGTLFRLEIPANTLTKLIDFSGTSNGRYPYGSLIQAENGRLYGTTQSGGANNFGTLFEFDPVTNKLTKQIDFTGTTNGRSPYGSLVEAENGKLYGTTQTGGTNNFGTLFEFDPTTNTFTKRIDFTGTTNGRSPYGSLVEASNKKLYGLTFQGGTNNFGTLFEFETTTNTLTKHVDFSGTLNGQNPRGSLSESDNGKLYGITASGGTYSRGTLFEFDPATNALMKKIDFDGITGSYPQYTRLLKISVSTLPVSLTSFSTKTDNGQIAILWKTASETNNNYFELEHSQNGNEWNKLVKVVGHGTTNSSNSYQYLHKNPYIGTNFYRLKQIDFDGTHETLETLRIEYLMANKKIRLVPNPAEAHISFLGNIGTNPKIKIYALDGRDVSSKVKWQSSDQKTQLFIAEIPAGLYQVIINGAAYTFAKR